AVDAELQAAVAAAASPLEGAWADARGLLGLLEQAEDPDGLRQRIGAALRRIVERFYLLVVPRGHDRIVAVQAFFKGGAVRGVLLSHRPTRNNGGARVEGGWWARSLASAVKAGNLDLRKPSDAQRLATVLADVALDEV